ncbi:Uncharacterised protein [Mycobacterium tuberculosis]|nr:Uncharacterised protein [Mycobacterium tuberculosis]
MEELRKQRISAKSIGIGVTARHGGGIGAVELGNDCSDTGAGGDEMASVFWPHASVREHGISEGLNQFVHEAVLRLAGQFVPLDAEFGGDALEQGAAHLPFVALDQVKVAR